MASWAGLLAPARAAVPASGHRLHYACRLRTAVVGVRLEPRQAACEGRCLSVRRLVRAHHRPSLTAPACLAAVPRPRAFSAIGTSGVGDRNAGRAAELRAKATRGGREKQAAARADDSRFEEEPEELVERLQGLVDTFQTLRARQVYDFMRQRGVNPDMRLWGQLLNLVCTMDAGPSLRMYLELRASVGDDLLVELRRAPTDPPLPRRRLPSELQKQGGVDDPDVFLSLQSMVKILNTATRHQNMETAFSVFDDMVELGHQPPLSTYRNLILSCVRSFTLDRAYDVLQLLVSAGLTPSPEVMAPILQGHLMKGQLNEANKVWDEMESQGLVLTDTKQYAFMIRECVKQQRWKAVQVVVARMARLGIPPDVHTYKALLRAAAKTKDYEMAFRLLDEMKATGVEPLIVHHNNTLFACMSAGRFDLAFKHLQDMLNAGIYLSDASYATVVSGCLRHHWVGGAMAVLTRGLGPEGPRVLTNTCNTALTKLVYAGDLRRAVTIAHEMSVREIPMHTGPLDALVTVLVNGRDIHTALNLYLAMYNAGFVVPRLTYKMLLFGSMRAGLWQAADQVASHMHTVGMRRIPEVDKVLEAFAGVADGVMDGRGATPKAAAIKSDSKGGDVPKA